MTTKDLKALLDYIAVHNGWNNSNWTRQYRRIKCADVFFDNQNATVYCLRFREVLGKPADAKEVVFTIRTKEDLSDVYAYLNEEI